MTRQAELTRERRPTAGSPEGPPDQSGAGGRSRARALPASVLGTHLTRGPAGALSHAAGLGGPLGGHVDSAPPGLGGQAGRRLPSTRREPVGAALGSSPTHCAPRPAASPPASVRSRATGRFVR